MWLLDSIRAVVDDEGFQLETPPAKCARETAVKLIALSQEAECQSKFSDFADQLSIHLGPVFATKPNKSQKLQRKQMWHAYHSLRTSSTFVSRWSSFISATVGEVQPSPILMQYVTNKFLHRFIQCQFSLAEEEVIPAQQQALTYEERNTLHYTAGAVCHTLKKRITKSKHPSKGDLIIGIDDLCTAGDGDGDNDAQDWEDLVDRGGLSHAKDETYQLFYAMEMFVRRHLTIQTADKLTPGSRSEIEKAILEDEEVLFAWSIASVELDNTTGNILLKLIVELWLTIRGFSFAGAFIEQYKNTTKVFRDQKLYVRKCSQINFGLLR